MTARERIETLLDKGTFDELDKFVAHRCTHYGMEQPAAYPGDGVVYRLRQDRRPPGLSSTPTTPPRRGGSLSASETPAEDRQGADSSPSRTARPSSPSTTRAEPAYRKAWTASRATRTIFLPEHHRVGCHTPSLGHSRPLRRRSLLLARPHRLRLHGRQSKSHMFVTGPDVVKAVTHEEVGKEELGGAYAHSSKSGVAHFIGPTPKERRAHAASSELLGFLPSNNMEDAPLVARTSDDVHRQDERAAIPLIPGRLRTCPTTSKSIIEPVVDDHYFFEVMPHFAKNVVIGFARLGGRPVGIVANNPAFLAGGARHRRLGQGGAFHPLLRLLQHTAHYARGCTRLLAGMHAGARRHHPPRREDQSMPMSRRRSRKSR